MPLKNSRRTAAWAFLLPMVFSIGCNAIENPGVKGIRRMNEAGNKIVGLLSTVSDAASAEAVTAEVAELYQELVAAHLQICEHEQASGGETRGLKTTIDQVQRDMAAMQANLQREVERVKGIEGLPASFWAPIRKHSYELLANTMHHVIALGQAEDVDAANLVIDMARLYELHPAEKVVEAAFSGMPPSLHDKMAEQILARLPEGVEMIHLTDGGNLVSVLAPLTIDQLEAAGIGQILMRHDGRNDVEMIIDASTFN